MTITEKEKREALYEILDALYVGENRTQLEEGEFTIQTEMERTGRTYAAVKQMVLRGVKRGVLEVKKVMLNGKKTNVYRVKSGNSCNK